MTFLFGAFPSVLAREYTLLVEFPSAEGVSTNTPVLRDGVKIARVVDIQLLEEQGVRIELAMDENHQLSHKYIPRIGTGSVITGDATLEFVKANEQQLARIFPSESDRSIIPAAYGDEEYIRYGIKKEDPFNMLFGLEEEVRSTMASIRRAGDAIDSAGQNVSQLVMDVRQTSAAPTKRSMRLQMKPSTHSKSFRERCEKCAGSSVTQN